ncbi:MAG: T9SS type A sorting domain-containing protein [Chlorobi bacterium]|nr:T9SS type A sorting domain-containing protein [Chlorobiota bacterium]
MFKKLFTISLVLVLASTLIMAQTSASKRIVLKPGGGIFKTLDSKVPVKDALQKTSIKFGNKEVNNFHFAAPLNINAVGTIDTITYPKMAGGAFNVNFVFDGQDVELMWFVAPADLTIKAAGFSVSDISGNANNSSVSVRLMKLNWTPEQLKTIAAPLYQGYYPSVGDGMNESDPFGDDATAPWVVGDSTHMLPPWADNANPDDNTWDYDLWSDFGVGYPVTIDAVDASKNSYHWVEMSLLGSEPTVLRGEVFAVVLTNDGTAWDDPDTPDRIGFFSDNSIGFPGWKYYEAGRLSADQPGWWARKYTWNFAVVADLTGDRPPVITDPTQLLSGLDVGPFTIKATVTDDNPSGGNAGVAEVLLQYAIDGGNYSDVAMTNIGGDVFSGDIPAQAPGANISYKIQATDVEGGVTVREMKDFNVFKPEFPTLLLVNGPVNYLAYYFGYAAFPHDTWQFGMGSADLFSHYQNIIELTANNNGPSFNHDSLITEWLNGDPSRNYALLGDEYLGVWSNWTDGPHVAGEFVYDVLGITYEYNDINLPDPSYQLPSMLETIEGPQLGDSLFVAFNANSPNDTLWYDPAYEIGGYNFLDGVDVTDDTEVDVYGYGSDGTKRNVAIHRTLPAGNKIAFIAYDVLSLDSKNPYVWYSAMTEAPHYQILDWWGLINSVREIGGNQPKNFEISQNYPNPFNPSTVIRYSIPEISKVSLKVYNMLGQEVAQLVNSQQAPGNYEVDFDASNLSSGVYFYTIKAGQFASTRKMILIK